MQVVPSYYAMAENGLEPGAKSKTVTQIARRLYTLLLVHR